MIVVCEPQCEGLSHEKVNSGFLTLARRAFPGETIRVYAAESHHDALRSILAHDQVEVEDLELRSFTVRDAYTARGMLGFYRQFLRLLEETVAAGATEILFLSTGPVLMHLLKRLHQRPAFAQLRFAFVMHAELEDIANDRYREVGATVVAEPSLLAKLRMIRPSELPGKVAGLVGRQLSARYARAWHSRFRTRDELQAQPSPSYRLIALSPHVVANARNFIDVEALGMRAIEMPINFARVAPAPANAHLKFATFGYGDPGALRQVVEYLDRLAPKQPYEVRIIGMDNRGLEHHPHVTCPSPGKRLSRAEMEHQAGDIDAFLILYDRQRYRLSCSGSIFEAFSYVKPVLHIGNPCVAHFDQPEHPIGFAHENLEQLAHTMVRMIDAPQAAHRELAERRVNLETLRTRLSIDHHVAAFRDVIR
ncbi:glycosyltransferase [soil metagenome]